MLRKISLALLAALLTLAFSAQSEYLPTQTISISVGRDGFDHLSNYIVEVEVGKEVTVTFTYADGDLTSDNPHEIRLAGLGLDLPTVVLSRDHPTASITFTPTKTGTINFYCVIPCIGMELLTGGKINVVAPKASGAATLLTLDFTPQDDGTVLARATLTDSKGGPAAGQPVIFKQQTSVGGELELGSIVTTDDGSAVVSIPAVIGQTLYMTAEFDGGNGFGFTRVASSFTVQGIPDPYPIGDLSSATPPFVLALVLFIVLGGIWATYGTVVYQVFLIRKNG